MVLAYKKRKNHNYFQQLTDFGKCDLVNQKINLTDDQLIEEPLRRIPPALYTEVKEHLVEMTKAGAIKQSHSTYSLNIEIAIKKDGWLSFSVDFCQLNKNYQGCICYSLNRRISLSAGAKYVPYIDLRSGYWQDKASFQIGGRGYYEFNQMTFGLCSAPATFQRLMEWCMGI